MSTYGIRKLGAALSYFFNHASINIYQSNEFVSYSKARIL